jgi:hypothetical protein
MAKPVMNILALHTIFQAFGSRQKPPDFIFLAPGACMPDTSVKAYLKANLPQPASNSLEQQPFIQSCTTSLFKVIYIIEIREHISNLYDCSLCWMKYNVEIKG